MRTLLYRAGLLALLALGGFTLMPWQPPAADSACCYFAAKDRAVHEPAQKVFITWDPRQNLETITLQPSFEGNAADFAIVVPTPSKPKMERVPKEIFKELAIFTILEPMDLDKYPRPMRKIAGGAAPTLAAVPKESATKPLEIGMVETLKYEIIQGDRAADIYGWLNDNKYSSAGNEATLDSYIQKRWFFTVMRIDPRNINLKPEGTLTGEITPFRIAFATEKPIYPLRITQASAKEQTEVMFYIQAADKADLPAEFSYQPTWVPMWSRATALAVPNKLSKGEVDWQEYVQPQIGRFLQGVQEMRRSQRGPATLEWAKRLTGNDIAVLEGRERYKRNAPKEDVEKLKLLRGYLQPGQFLTKVRKVFTKGEMTSDLELVRARVGDREDNTEYYSILPASPP